MFMLLTGAKAATPLPLCFEKRDSLYSTKIDYGYTVSRPADAGI